MNTLPEGNLQVEIAGVTLPNPVMPASGTYEFSNRDKLAFDPAMLGAVVNKTIFIDPRLGNPPPRIYETPCGMLNSIGIPSEGVESFIKKQLPMLRKIGPPVIVSIAEHDVERFCLLAEQIETTGMADIIELDLSCPNIEKGTHWATDRKSLEAVVSAVVKRVGLPVAAKLSPSVIEISDMAVCAEEAGAAAVSMVNTFRGIAIDIEQRKPVLGNIVGGLSGPAIRPLAMYAVYSCYKRINIPIIGMGGIACWRDAVEFMQAGATAVAVGMQNFVNPRAMEEIIIGLNRYLAENGFESARDIIGLAARD